MTRPPPGYDQAHPGFARSLVAGEKVDTQAKPRVLPTSIGYRGMPNSEQPRGKGITRTHLNYNNDYPAHVGDAENPATGSRQAARPCSKTMQLLYYIQHTVGEERLSVADDEGFDSPCHRAQIDQWIRDAARARAFPPHPQSTFQRSPTRARAGASSACTPWWPARSNVSRARPGCSKTRWPSGITRWISIDPNGPICSNSSSTVSRTFPRTRLASAA